MQKILLASLILFLTSCAAPKNFIYYENAGSFTGQEVLQSYENKIQKDDVLAIMVGSQSPELTAPFNPVGNTTASSVKNEPYGHLVDAQGDIVFPIIGKIHVLGMTHKELAAYIEKAIIDGGYIKDPSVSVSLQNFKISVLGEVKAPGVKAIASERVTIFDAIGLAGDLTIYGLRNNISIIREEDGKRALAYVDISNKEIFNSPYYYLRPNDIVYVQPNKKQQKASNTDLTAFTMVVSSTSLLISIANLIMSIARF